MDKKSLWVMGQLLYRPIADLWVEIENLKELGTVITIFIRESLSTQQYGHIFFRGTKLRWLQLLSVRRKASDLILTRTSALVGLRSPGEYVQVNFGIDPSTFDIKEYAGDDDYVMVESE